MRDELEAGGEVLPVQLRGRRNRDARGDAEDRDAGEEVERPGGDVDRDRLDGEDHAADRRSDDDPDLVRHAAQGDRPRQEVRRHDLRRKRASGRVRHRRSDARRHRNQEEGPELVRAGERDRDEHRGDPDLEGEPDRDDEPALDAVGELAGGEREDRQRQKFSEPDEAEVERVLVDRVHLPADRDHEHLQRECVRERRRPEQREVGQL